MTNTTIALTDLAQKGGCRLHQANAAICAAAAEMDVEALCRMVTLPSLCVNGDARRLFPGLALAS